MSIEPVTVVPVPYSILIAFLADGKKRIFFSKAFLGPSRTAIAERNLKWDPISTKRETGALQPQCFTSPKEMGKVSEL